MKHELNNSRRREWGSVAVEAALVLPVFLLLVFGGIEYSRYFWAKNVVTDAAAEGARVAVLADSNDSEVMDRVAQVLTNQGLTGDHSVEIGHPDSAQYVSVKVELDFRFLVLQNLIPSVEQYQRIAASSVMVPMP